MFSKDILKAEVSAYGEELDYLPPKHQENSSQDLKSSHTQLVCGHAH